MRLCGQRIAAQPAAELEARDFREHPIDEGPERAVEQRQLAEIAPLMEHRLDLAMAERGQAAFDVAREKNVNVTQSIAPGPCWRAGHAQVM